MFNFWFKHGLNIKSKTPKNSHKRKESYESNSLVFSGTTRHLYFYCRILLIVNDSSRNEKVKMYTFNTPLSQSSLRFVLQRYNENAESPNLLTYILSWSYVSNT